MSRNRVLALVLVAFVAAACVIAATAILLLPDETVKKLDVQFLRVALLLLSALVSVWIGTSLYHLWHDTTPLRMTRSLIHYIRAVGMTATVSPVGLFGLQHFQGLGLSITLGEAGIASAFCLISVIVSLHFYNNQYERQAREANVD